MKAIYTYIYLSLLFSSLLLSVNAQDLSANLVITNVDVIPLNSDSDQVIRKQNVFIRDGIIEEISQRTNISQEYEKIDGTNKYLIPGFADMHAHLPGFQSQPYPIEDYFLLNIANGVTTVRGMRGHPSHLTLRDSVKSNKILAPQLFISSPPLTKEHNQLSVEDLKVMLQQYEGKGYDFVKVLSLDSYLYDPIMDYLIENDWLVAGHSPNKFLRLPVTAGQHSIEHIEPFVNSYKQSPSRINELLRSMATQGISNCPDIYWYYVYGNQLPLDSLKMIRGIDYVSLNMREDWENYWQERNSDKQRAHELKEGYRNDIAVYMQLMKKMDGLGIQLLISPGDGMFIIPGFSYLMEMKIFEQAGLTPYNILKASSYNAAMFFGEDVNWGQIKTGYRADMILLEENPLSSISNVRNIAGVILNGNWLPKSFIDEQLENLKEKYASP